MFPENTMLLGSYDYRLVVLSVVIATFASYAALDLAGRVSVARGSARVGWLAGGASAMGLGIWSMHYIGMLAFRLPIPVWYDWPIVVLSLLAAIFASAAALHFASGQEMSLWRTAFGSLVMGGGIGAMHYIGMHAMRMGAMCHFNPSVVVLSIVLAVLISFVALRLVFLARDHGETRRLRGAASAIVMGAAIPIMHYTGMAAASFTVSDVAAILSHAVDVSINRSESCVENTKLRFKCVQSDVCWRYASKRNAQRTWVGCPISNATAADTASHARLAGYAVGRGWWKS
jgi:two-component system sensor histidine kinase/response regulator